AKVLPLLLLLLLLLPVAKSQRPRAGLLLFANGSSGSATKMLSATIPLPVNFLTVMYLSGRADIGPLFQPRNIPGGMFRCVLCALRGNRSLILVLAWLYPLIPAV